MDIHLHPVLQVWLDLEPEDQKVVEFRHDGCLWQHRTVPLHEDILVVVTLDTFLSLGYSEIVMADWYSEYPASVARPLAFSSVDDLKNFLWEHPMLEMAAEAVLHWLEGDAKIESIMGFNLDITYCA